MKIFLVLFLSFSVLLISCSKDGEQGPPGQDGNANVLSITVSVDSSNWQEFELNNTTYFETTVGLSELTAEIVEKGALLVYLKIGNQLTPLPLTFYFNDNIDATYSFTYTPGQVFLGLQYNALIEGGEPLTNEFKFVIIDGLPQSATKSLPISDYNKLMEHLSQMN
jgi:hypothetical protein